MPFLMLLVAALMFLVSWQMHAPAQSVRFAGQTAVALTDGNIGTGNIVHETGATIDTATLTTPTLTDQIDQEAHVSGAFTLTTNTTLAAISGFDQAMTAAGKYACHGHIHFTTAPTSSNGLKIALATSDTLTVTTLEFTAMAFNGAAFATTGVGTATALAGTAIATSAAMTDVLLNAAVVVNAGGTLQVQMAENASSGTIAATAGNAAWECHRAS